MSLRTRWALTLALLTAVFLGVGIAASTLVIEKQLRNQVDADLTERLSLLPSDVRGFFAQGFRRGNGDFRRQIARPDAVIQVVLDADTVLRFEDAPALPVDDVDVALAHNGEPALFRTVDVDGAPYRMLTAPFETPRLQGAIQIAVETSRIDRVMAALRVRLGVAWLIASALAGLVGWLAARGTVRPIEQLTSAAEEVAATERLDVPLDTDAPAEIGRLASAFGSMLAALQRSRVQQQQLASDAGHELRTPLTALRTNLETLRRRGDDLSPDQRSELLDAAITEVGELSALSSELVDLASDAGRGAEERRPVALRDLVDTVVERFRSRRGQPIDVSGDGADVEARTMQLERAISNLIDNARKWSPPDQPIDIVVQGRSVIVRDRGPGIPSHDLEHVFERFYRSVEARTTPGSGLGLAIVETIIAGHGGTVIARNHPDGGAEVGFEL